MPKLTKSERRKHPRVTQRVPIALSANGYDFTTTTQNISCVGAYCHIDKYVPPFTKVLVKMDLPSVASNFNVECRGVVVRTEDDRNSGFNVAIFFNEMKDLERKKISRYISQLLSHGTSSSRL
jgi:hypothetical protein